MGGVVSGLTNFLTGADDVAANAQMTGALQSQAAKDAAAAAQFRPVGMTTRFGSSNFVRSIDPKTGMPYISSAGYTAAPELAALQERLFGMFGQGLTEADLMRGQYAPLSGAAGSLFNLGQQYLAQSPEEAAANYMKSQQGLLAGGREQQLANIRNQLFQTGRSGLATGGTDTGMMATNPEMAAYYNALAQQDAQIAAAAEREGQQRTMFGAGLFGTGAGLLNTQVAGQAGAYAPLQTQLGLAGQVESMAQQPYQLGIQLGQAAQPGQTYGANMYNQGMQLGLNTIQQGQAQANAINNQFLSSLIGSAATMGAGGGFGQSGGFLSSAAGTNAGFVNM